MLGIEGVGGRGRGWGQGGEMTQALYAHMNNKTIKKIISVINVVHENEFSTI
jgi:hypothetical protein